MSAPVVISLCDLTGNFVRPWVEAGFDAILVDPQHGAERGCRVMARASRLVCVLRGHVFPTPLRPIDRCARCHK